MTAWTIELEDDCVVLSSCEQLIMVKVKHHALDESFALRLRQESSLLAALPRVSRLVVNLEQVVVASSSGIALLVEMFQSMPPGARLYILKANAEISQLLRDTYLDKLFPVVDHVSELPDEDVNVI